MKVFSDISDGLTGQNITSDSQVGKGKKYWAEPKFRSLQSDATLGFGGAGGDGGASPSNAS